MSLKMDRNTKKREDPLCQGKNSAASAAVTVKALIPPKKMKKRPGRKISHMRVCRQKKVKKTDFFSFKVKFYKS